MNYEFSAYVSDPINAEQIMANLVRERVQEPVSHLLLGRSEPLPFERAYEHHGPAWADEAPMLSLAEMSAWMDKAQEDIRRTFGMPSYLLREDHGFQSLVRGSEMEVALMMERHYHDL